MEGNMTCSPGVSGLGAAGAELLLFLIPISLTQYVPNFFFGSLLMLFGVEITLDWLIFSFRKVYIPILKT